MSISFIVTSFNIAPYIIPCLESLRACLRDGDQVIVVDDGSTDGTVDVLEDFARRGAFGAGVAWRPIYLGTNTFGGVGIPANIGLNHAVCETVFFVDGDDYLLPRAFIAARLAYETNPADIGILDYLEFDQATGKTKLPADAGKWAKLEAAGSPEETRLAALALIAVPWRKFYRRAFLAENTIRFPEGAFFFEDNPFHWRVCTAARTISFSCKVVCHHRVNRPGQTMASTGRELEAFFDHFVTILGDLPEDEPEMRQQAISWLIGNMSWHLPRLRPETFHSYAARAVDALQLITDSDWAQTSQTHRGTRVWHHANHLRRGEIWDVINAWQGQIDRELWQRIDRELRSMPKLREDVAKLTQKLAITDKDMRSARDKLNGQIDKIGQRMATVEKESRLARELLHAQQAIDEFEALRDLLGDTVMPDIVDLAEVAGPSTAKPTKKSGMSTPSRRRVSQKV